MERGLTARRVATALAAAVAVLALGTIGFHRILHESWLESFYRALVTSSLTGLDTVPDDRGGLILSMVLVVCGVTIFAFAGAAVVEAIARGVFTGNWDERRRRRAIDNLREHTIICGYGRVGRRIAEEFRVIAGLVLRPQVAAFLNTATSADGPNLRFEQVEVPKACAAIGRSIHDIDVDTRTGASIVAVAKNGGEFHTRPAPLGDLFTPSGNGR